MIVLNILISKDSYLWNLQIHCTCNKWTYLKSDTNLVIYKTKYLNTFSKYVLKKNHFS
jgi:hypothetical protein